MTTGAGLAADVDLRLGGFRLDVSIRLPAGEVLGVLGPNGAGKSTLLRAVAGLVGLDRGSVHVDGHVWADTAGGVDLPATDRRVGYVFQDYRLFPHLSVLDNVAFAARARGARRSVARAAARDVLHRLGLDELRTRSPGSLSGGQAQRVAVARALAAEPAVLLLDEPLAALDARTRQELRGLLRRHLAEFAGPTLLVVHDPVEAMVLADRVLVVEAGRAVQSGRPAEVARRPATDYVARLMGLNLYRGTVTDATSGAVLLEGGGAFAATVVDAEAAEGRRVGDPVLVAVRPSSVSLHPHEPGPGSARNRWHGTVTGLDLLADRVRVSVDGPVPAAVDITPGALAELGLVEGSHVWASVKATEVLTYPQG